LGFHLAVFVSLFKVFTKSSFEEEHKNSDNPKENKDIGTIPITLPIGNNEVDREQCHKDIGIFKKAVYFISHSLFFLRLVN